MRRQAKALMALVTAAAGSGVAWGLLSEGDAQAVVAIASPIITYGLTWLVPNE